MTAPLRQPEFDFTEDEFYAHLDNPTAFHTEDLAKQIRQAYEALHDDDDRHIGVALYARLRRDNNRTWGDNGPLFPVSRADMFNPEPSWKPHVRADATPIPTLEALRRMTGWGGYFTEFHADLAREFSPEAADKSEHDPDYYLMILRVLKMSRKYENTFASNSKRATKYLLMSERATEAEWKFASHPDAVVLRLSLANWLNRGFDLFPITYSSPQVDQYSFTLAQRLVEDVCQEGKSMGLACHELSELMTISEGEREFCMEILRRLWVEHNGLNHKNILNAFQGTDNYLSMTFRAAAEVYYYNAPRSVTVVPTVPSFAVILPAMRLRFPVKLMSKHARGTHLQLDGSYHYEEPFRGWVRSEVLQLSGTSSTTWGQQGVLHVYNMIATALERNPDDTADWLYMSELNHYYMYGVMFTYRWALSFLSRLGLPLNIGKKPDPDTLPMMKAIAALPDSKLLAFARHSGFVFDWSGVDMQKVKTFLQEGYAKWCVVMSGPNIVGIMAMLCVIGFERMRRDQFAMLMALRGRIRSGDFKILRVARAVEYIGAYPPPRRNLRLIRFLNIFRKVSDNIALSIASDLTGQEKLSYKYASVAMTLSEDAREFVQGLPSHQQVVREMALTQNETTKKK